MKVKLAEQRKTATKKTKTEKPLEIFSSQEGSTPSPGARSRRKRKYCDWGGSHRKATRETTGRASRVSNKSNTGRDKFRSSCLDEDFSVRAIKTNTVISTWLVSIF